MSLLDLGLRTVKQPRVRVMVSERLRAKPNLSSLHRCGEAAEAILGILTRTALLAGLCQAVGFIVRAALENLGLHVAVALKILKRAAFGPIDRYLVKIDRA